jgi:hypothetical protein
MHPFEKRAANNEFFYGFRFGRGKFEKADPTKKEDHTEAHDEQACIFFFHHK